MNTHLFELTQSNHSKRMFILKNQFSARTIQEVYNEAIRRTEQNYFQELKPSKQLSLAVLGHGGSGKTTLISRLSHSSSVAVEPTTSTIGFDSGSFKIGENIFFYNDFAGQIEYLSIHHHFIARSLDVVFIVIDGTIQEDELRSQLRHVFLFYFFI